MALQIELKPIQSEIISSPARRKVIVAGRRSGKTFANIIMALNKMREGPNNKVWICMKTRPQAKDTYWDDLQHIFSFIPGCKTSKSELKITLPNGSSVTLKGTEADSSLRGSGLAMLIIDEAPFVKDGVIRGTLMPMVADTPGSVLVLSSSPYGKNNEFYDLYIHACKPDNDWYVKKFTTEEAKIVPPEELAVFKAILTPEEYAREFLAEFTDLVGIIYTNFKPEEHVVDWDYEVGELVIGMDFNLNPMACVIGIRHPGGIHLIDSIEQFNSDTEKLQKTVYEKYPTSKISVYPDPAGAAGKTSASSGGSDHNILAGPPFHWKVYSHAKHPRVRDRISAVQIAFRMGKITIQEGTCGRLVECLMKQSYKERSDEPEKNTGYDHLNDALGYMVEYLYPIMAPSKKLAGRRRPLRIDA